MQDLNGEPGFRLGVTGFRAEIGAMAEEVANLSLAGVKTVHLADIDSLVEKLLEYIDQSTFAPDQILYIETGARLLAASLHRKRRISTSPIVIRRAGSSTKVRYSFLFRLIPVSILDLLRKLERRRSSSAPNIRHIEAAPDADFTRKRVLILDDAADSGESLLLARRWVMERGAAECDIKFATISVTQAKARELVSYWIYPQLCRFPWSSDSMERQEYVSLYEQIDPGQLAVGDL
jgi:hypoxanthine phosphoribosyltransferase